MNLIILGFLFFSFLSFSSTSIVGGFMEIKTNRRDVKDAANFALQELNRRRSKYSLELVKIDSAYSQVVSGTNYKLKLTYRVVNDEGIQVGKNKKQTVKVYKHWSEKEGEFTSMDIIKTKKNHLNDEI